MERQVQSLRLPPASYSYISGNGGSNGSGGEAGASSSGNTSCGYCGAGGAGWVSDGGTGGYYGNNKGLTRTNGFLGGVANNNQTNGGLVVVQLQEMMGEVTTVTGMLAAVGILVVVVQGILTLVVVEDPTMVVAIKTTSRV